MHCHRRITSVTIRPLDSHDDVMHAHADLGGRKFITRFKRRVVNAYAKQLLIGKWDEDIATRRATVRTHQLGRILREVRATVGGLEPHGILGEIGPPPRLDSRVNPGLALMFSWLPEPSHLTFWTRRLKNAFKAWRRNRPAITVTNLFVAFLVTPAVITHRPPRRATPRTPIENPGLLRPSAGDRSLRQTEEAEGLPTGHPPGRRHPGSRHHLFIEDLNDCDWHATTPFGPSRCPGRAECGTRLGADRHHASCIFR